MQLRVPDKTVRHTPAWEVAQLQGNYQSAARALVLTNLSVTLSTENVDIHALH